MQAGYVAKKVARKSRRLCPVPSERRGPLRLRASPNFASSGIRERQISLSDAGFPAIRRSGIVEA